MKCCLPESTREFALDLNTSQSIIGRNLKKIGKVSKLGVSLPLTLIEKNKEDCISIATSLIQGWYIIHFSRISLQVTKKNRCFLTMLNTKAVNWKEWFPLTRSKGALSWKKYYAIFMVGPPRYCSFWDFKVQSDSQCILIFQTAAIWAWKSKKTPLTLQY